MVFVDTGAWYASLIPSDPDHVAAQSWLAQNRVPLVTSDYVIDETLTLLLVRGQKRRAIGWGQAVFSGALATLHCLTMSDLHAAWQVYQQFFDKDWSFTDCTSRVLMHWLGISAAFSFDQHFRQFGTVTVLP
jgi:uncharacterized protein